MSTAPHPLPARCASYPLGRRERAERARLEERVASLVRDSAAAKDELLLECLVETVAARTHGADNPDSLPASIRGEDLWLELFEPGAPWPHYQHAASGRTEWEVPSADTAIIVSLNGQCSFMYRYMLRESCSHFDSLPLTSLTISPRRSPNGSQRGARRGDTIGARRVHVHARRTRERRRRARRRQRQGAGAPRGGGRVERHHPPLGSASGPPGRAQARERGDRHSAARRRGRRAAERERRRTARRRSDAAQRRARAPGECSFMYRYISRESCSQIDSLPLTYLTRSRTSARRSAAPSTTPSQTASPRSRPLRSLR